MYLCCLLPYMIYYPTVMAWYSLFVLKVPLNPKQTNMWCWPWPWSILTLALALRWPSSWPWKLLALPCLRGAFCSQILCCFFFLTLTLQYCTAFPCSTNFLQVCLLKIFPVSYRLLLLMSAICNLHCVKFCSWWWDTTAKISFTVVSFVWKCLQNF